MIRELLLPATDGIRLLEGVPGLTDVPGLFISACGREETIAKALDAGAADYIVKPFSPTELTARVRSRALPAGGTGHRCTSGAG
ncbi:MAG: response regulator [Bryobacterales bacterium]|nr:response regulator [Bryobacterales bacterium]